MTRKMQFTAIAGIVALTGGLLITGATAAGASPVRVHSVCYSDAAGDEAHASALLALAQDDLSAAYGDGDAQGDTVHALTLMAEAEQDEAC